MKRCCRRRSLISLLGLGAERCSGITIGLKLQTEIRRRSIEGIGIKRGRSGQGSVR